MTLDGWIAAGTGAANDACAKYRTLCRALRDLELDLLHLIHLEDRVLFPRALGMERRGRT